MADALQTVNSHAPGVASEAAILASVGHFLPEAAGGHVLWNNTIAGPSWHEPMWCVVDRGGGCMVTSSCCALAALCPRQIWIVPLLCWCWCLNVDLLCGPNDSAHSSAQRWTCFAAPVSACPAECSIAECLN